MPFTLQYARANTARWAGGGGVNLQNINRNKVRGWNLRSIFVAAKDYVFIQADFGQIEPRTTMFLTGDNEALELLRQGGRDVDLYEIHARTTMGYTDPRPLKETNHQLRHLAKARVIALAYGVGGPRFKDMAKELCGIDLSLEDATEQVKKFRASSPRVIRLWRDLEKALTQCDGGTCRIPLPNTQIEPAALRFLHYYNVFAPPDAWDKAAYVGDRGGRMSRIYGGALLENLVQAVARDIMADAWLRCADAG